MNKYLRMLIILTAFVSIGFPKAESVLGDGIENLTYLPLITNNYQAPVINRTNIVDITTFLEQCPNNDPLYSKLRSDFIIRIDGVVIGDIPCTEPVSSLTNDEYSSALEYLQAIRTTYYMDTGIPNLYPWTSMNLYNWMISNVAGLNLKTDSGAYCCDVIDGKKYVVIPNRHDLPPNLVLQKNWNGISSSIGLLAHEIRHAAGGPGHTTGCAAFPNPGDPLGCDQDYDLANLGSYGIQYWLGKSWSTGFINVGINCAPDGGLNYAKWQVANANSMLYRFVQNLPPTITLPPPPYGGSCLAP